MALIVSLVGIPMLFGYLYSIIYRSVTTHDTGLSTNLIVGSYVPIVDRLLNGMLLLGYSAVPFASITVAQFLFFVLDGSIEYGSGVIGNIVPLVVVGFSAFMFYLMPFFIFIAAYQEAYNRSGYDIVRNSIISTVVSVKYLKGFIIFVLVSLIFSFVAFIGTLNILLYFFSIIITPLYIIAIGNVIGSVVEINGV